MYTKQIIKPFRVAIAAGLLSAIFVTAPAQAVDQSVWLQEQIAITDGASYSQLGTPGGAPSQGAGKFYKMDAQSVWVQAQLAVTDGSSSYIRNDAEPVYAGAPRPGSNAMADKQFAFVEHGLHQTDGCNE